MHAIKGIPVSPGVAISRAVVIDAEDLPIPRRTVSRDGVPAERERLVRAIEESIADIERLREQASATVGPELAKIFDVHVAMLKDRQLTGQFNQLLDNEMVTAEYAVFVVMRRQARLLRSMDSHYFREREKDVWDLERRVLGHLIGDTRAELSQLRQEAVLVAHDLTPSQTAGLDRTRIKGIATDAGGPTSHTAILAHALGIPAIVGTEDVTQHVDSGDTVIIDGHRGIVIVSPDAAKLMEYRRRRAAKPSLDEMAHLPAITQDGVEVSLQANIEFPSEIGPALEKGAEGIGLYRTEFLYLAAATEPTEQEQYEAYLESIRVLDGRPLTVRTLDLGADKIVSTEDQPEHAENNPFLGCRSIRLCLQNLALFKTQLRAILRASAAGPVRIMFPLISNVMELRQAKMILNDVIEDLEEEGAIETSQIPVGIMIEVPSAALLTKLFVPEVDFFSIGTNDLIQYTLAVDRGNERVASLYTAAHPAVIQLIREVVRTAKRNDKEVGLCGEMAGEPEFVMLLLGMGLTSFSITPPAIPGVKKIIRSVSMTDCQRVARRVNSFDSDREVHTFLREQARKIAPEVMDEMAMEH